MLRVVEDDTVTEMVTGESVMDEIGVLLNERLPLVPLDDPYRGSLMSWYHLTYGFAKARGRVS